jgi:hypothetical protein
MLQCEICCLFFYGSPSLTRGRVCNLQCNHSMVRVAQNPKPYFTVSSETPPTWRARFPYLYLPGTWWPSYTPGHWVPFTSSLRLAGLRWRYSDPPPTWRARFPYLYPSGRGLPSYTPGHWVPFTSSLMTRRARWRYPPPPGGTGSYIYSLQE